jgi:hypothetical protein
MDLLLGELGPDIEEVQEEYKEREEKDEDWLIM